MVLEIEAPFDPKAFYIELASLVIFVGLISLDPTWKNEYQINLVNYIFNLLQFYMHVVINYQDFDPGLLSLLFIFSPKQ